MHGLFDNLTVDARDSNVVVHLESISVVILYVSSPFSDRCFRYFCLCFRFYCVFFIQVHTSTLPYLLKYTRMLPIGKNVYENLSLKDPLISRKNRLTRLPNHSTNSGSVLADAFLLRECQSPIKLASSSDKCLNVAFPPRLMMEKSAVAKSSICWNLCWCF